MLGYIFVALPGLESVFSGLIFIVYPEHVIIVDYCLDFRGLFFFTLRVTKIKPSENFLLIITCIGFLVSCFPAHG